ncbi:MAG: hypothetical protein KKF00_11345 [Proteobacteria bacterium]|nr:hypothetical protein [Pseudomonadota bacterium]
MKAKLYWGERERTVKNIIMIMTTGIVVLVQLSGCATSGSGYSPLFRSEYQSSLQDKSDLWLQNRLVEIDTDIAQLGVHFPEKPNTYKVTPNYGYGGGYTVSPQKDKYSAGLDGFKKGRTSKLLGEKSLILQELNRRRFLK